MYVMGGRTCFDRATSRVQRNEVASARNHCCHSATLAIDLIRQCRKDPFPRHLRCHCRCVLRLSLVLAQVQGQPRRRRPRRSRKDLLDISRDFDYLYAPGWHRASRGSPPPSEQGPRHRRYHRDRWIDSHHGRQCPRRNSKRGSG